MAISVQHTSFTLHPMRTRMAFRYGIATVRELQHLVLRMTVAVDGQQVEGVSADHLAPRWFVKDPGLTLEQEVQLLLLAVLHACDLACEVGESSTPFDLWWQAYHAQMNWAKEKGIAPLIASFGMSLVERAVIHAFCRATRTPFARALRDNTLGIVLERIYPELKGTQPRDYLPSEPLHHIIVRHTVGLGDPLTDAEIPPEERLHDGLPQSLQECIRVYGLTHFKIKLSGDVQVDRERLRSMARLLRRECAVFRLTLDANEMYPDMETFRVFWESLQADTDLRELVSALIFVEQPLHRDEALSHRTRKQLQCWHEHPPMIIDESDAELNSLPAALECGYSGCSVKSCKGVFKGIANACLTERLCRQGKRVLISGEDLTTVPPVSLQQDLALMANLGIPHVERNGYHYFRGLSMLPLDVQHRLLAEHPDLFTPHGQDFVTVKIENGGLRTQSVTYLAYGVA
ncbi:MAG: mandelate racemase [Armatimonadota bacterium]|nr:MAG: mandelate racemase [Armatimonadota bacterium]